jgi:hypothetical protein
VNPRCHRGKRHREVEDAAYAVNGTPCRDRFSFKRAKDTRRLSVANVVRVSDRQSAFTVDVVS